MAQEGSLTPEKQLLRLIEDSGGGKSAPAAKPRIEKQAIKYHSQSLISPGAWLGRFSFLKEKFKGIASGERSHIDMVKGINAALMLAIGILAIYFVGNLTVTLMNQKKIPAPQETQALAAGQRTEAVPTHLQSLDYYTGKIQQRNIFRMGKSSAGSLEAPAGDRITELTKNLRLVGISWSANPDAMIEDTKISRTFFVKKGAMIGELLVKDITKDAVIIGLGEDRAELR